MNSGTAVTLVLGQLSALRSILEHLDTLALGILGVNVALVAAVVAAQTSLDKRWWWPLPGFACSAFACVVALRTSAHVGVGPDPISFFEKYGAKPVSEANEALFTDLWAAAEAAPLQQKQRAFRFGFYLLLATIIAAVVVFVAGR